MNLQEASNKARNNAQRKQWIEELEITMNAKLQDEYYESAANIALCINALVAIQLMQSMPKLNKETICA